MSPRPTYLRLDPIRCDAYGICAELVPELVERDEWGYPILQPGAVPPELAQAARNAVALCPRLALRLESEPQRVARSA